MAEKFEINVSDNLKNMGGSIRSLAGIALVLLLAVGGFTSFYTVPAESQGVILRFGQYVRTTPSGLHFKLPFGIEKKYVLPVERQLQLEFGFGTPGATNPTQYSNSATEQRRERNMVTGDLNAATVEWTVQYRIADPRSFLFEVRDPEVTMRHISESVMRAVVGDRTVDEVITIGRQEIENESLVMMQDLANRYGLGLSIDQVQLKDVNPPEPVRPSFNEVNQAQQEREKAINIANGEYNKVIPRARGQAEQRIQAAEGYALKRVNEAEGDIARFNAVLEEYLKAPEVTKRRLYLETMQEVLPGIERKIIVDKDANQILPLMQISTERK
ncbi:FtsH protease activity modulator HflK [Pelagicoccus sp. SDUM812003]|nr:FtsH protease activity modulator HflK [Pelagicoccus sp. SDUM812003]MDQ8203775.1 FtsH protease activity modulator HflK [Pelagicoccus sp. SDUM812003]